MLLAIASLPIAYTLTHIVQFSNHFLHLCIFLLNSIMSYTKNLYDTCQYNSVLNQSVAPIWYILNPIKYEHCRKCRIEKGIIGGQNVSHIDANLVDIENDLRGQTRFYSRCPSNKFLPGKTPSPTLHLRSCQLFDYPEIPKEPPMPRMGCR
jgi:hypothetical protein